MRSAKVNCDRFQQLCRQVGIRAYPTVLYFGGGTDSGQQVPNLNPDHILNFVENKLKSRKKARQIRDEL